MSYFIIFKISKHYRHDLPDFDTDEFLQSFLYQNLPELAKNSLNLIFSLFLSKNNCHGSISKNPHPDISGDYMYI